MHATVSDWQVADREVETPKSGGTLRNLGLRMRLPVETLALSAFSETLVGAVVWARPDDQNGLDEAVIDTGTFRFLTQAALAIDSDLLEVGSSASVTGELESVGEYEYEYQEFGLPDVRTDWRVESASQDSRSFNWRVVLTPLV